MQAPQQLVSFLHDSAFWWALIASIWAVTSDYLGSNPKMRQNATYQLLIDLISSIIRGQAQRSGRNRQRNRRR